MRASNYILLDAARMNEEFAKTKGFSIKSICLLNEKREECLRTVAPYLFSTQKHGKFEQWIYDEGWGRSWGVFIDSVRSLAELHFYFRKLFLFKSGQGEEIYFRFFDPRVLRNYLPTCSQAKLGELFGSVNKFICEDKDPSYVLFFSFDGKQLLSERKDAQTALRIHGDT